MLISVGLCFDTLAVSISTGLSHDKISFREGVRVALILAFFQGLMPFIGWYAGIQVEQYVKEYDHWVAFSLLGFLGVKMIIAGIRVKEQEVISRKLSFLYISGMGIATSIDALAVGITFGLIEVNIYQTVCIIGAVTFLSSMLGILVGKKAGNKMGSKMEVIGGAILFLIGLKILLEHLLSGTS
ncbi:MAG: manganese efflux pump MntP family protein [Bacteroidetes bacterium]|nr:manganese efflux pump MntP family protein [Bacteroidota bacterium]